MEILFLGGGGVVIWVSHLVVGVLEVGAVSPLSQDDGLHVFSVQTSALCNVSSWLQRRVVVLEGDNRDSINILLPNANLYTQAFFHHNLTIMHPQI